MTDDSTIADYDAVTAADIAEFLHHLADLRIGAPGEDLAARAAFLTAKADLFTRIADQHAETDPGYATQVRQMARDARDATAVPRQVGAKSEKNSTRSRTARWGQSTGELRGQFRLTQPRASTGCPTPAPRWTPSNSRASQPSTE